MDETVLLGHGSGGTMMKRIIDEVLLVLKLLRLESDWPILQTAL